MYKILIIFINFSTFLYQNLLLSNKKSNLSVSKQINTTHIRKSFTLKTVSNLQSVTFIAKSQANICVICLFLKLMVFIIDFNRNIEKIFG
jgi:hypothetical protein